MLFLSLMATAPSAPHVDCRKEDAPCGASHWHVPAACGTAYQLVMERWTNQAAIVSRCGKNARLSLGNDRGCPRLAFQSSENKRTSDQCRHRVQRKPRTRSKEANHGKVWKELGLQRKSFRWLRIPSFVVGVAELLVGAGASACRPVEVWLYENVHPGDGFQDEERLGLQML